MENNLTVTLGGVERTLAVNKMPFLKHFGKITEKTGFNLFDPSNRTNPLKAYQSVLYIIEAALKCNGVDATPEEVEKWVEELDIELLEDIQYAALSAMSGKPVEQLKNASAQAVKNGVLS